jgi:hypothetical protein
MTDLSRPPRWWEEPRYVETGGELVFRQPFIAEGVRMYSFVLDADVNKLNRWLDRSFNEPLRDRFAYRAHGRHMLLSFVRTRRLLAGPPDQFGFLDELEVAIWILAQDCKNQGAKPVWAVPYMFVATPAPLATGREVYGFPKQLGTITIPKDLTTTPETLLLCGPTLERFDPDAEVKDGVILQAWRDAIPEKLQPIWDAGKGPDQFDLAKALAGRRGRRFRTMLRLLQEAPLLTALGGQLARRKVPIVLLKQFRSVLDPDRACYQAVVGVDLEITAFRQLGVLPDDYTVKLEKLANEPFFRELGLTGELKPQTAFWLDFDFKLESAKSVARLDIMSAKAEPAAAPAPGPVSPAAAP